tara:strand:- start:281 stop:988 length:708 start_codon:yes stop_codon:yes gene_type:complete
MNKKIKTAVILAGGKGTRMREHPVALPKPMVEIGGKPVLIHIMDYLSSFQEFNFIICTGYKEEIIFDYFDNVKYPNVKTLSTGDETQTGGRIKQVKEHIDSDFLMTYGDGLANVNITKLIESHNQSKKTATMTVNKPVLRFGLVNFDEKGEVESFVEKPTLDYFVNIGYMIFTPEIFDFIPGDIPFENEPLVNLAKSKQLNAYKHNGYFKPMDTYREYLELNKLWDSGKAPWKVS